MGRGSMRGEWKHWVKDWIPPDLRRLFPSPGHDEAVRYSGDFATWDEARARSSGYDAPAIVEKVRLAIGKVQRGEAACERDSVVFTRVQHAFPLLAGLLRAALADGGRLNVADIGGSLAGTYFQSREILQPAVALHWNV